jgi:hypothetical protein
MQTTEIPAPTQAQADDFKEQAAGFVDPEPPPATEAPTNVDVPYVSGNGVVGDTLNCTTGNWNGTPTGYAYAWAADGAPNGATGDTYTVVAGDAGKSITCVVTAANDAGSTAAPPSNAVAIAAAAATTTTQTETRRK